MKVDVYELKISLLKVEDIAKVDNYTGIYYDAK